MRAPALMMVCRQSTGFDITRHLARIVNQVAASVERFDHFAVERAVVRDEEFGELGIAEESRVRPGRINDQRGQESLIATLCQSTAAERMVAVWSIDFVVVVVACHAHVA